jgi:hypothetical protein
VCEMSDYVKAQIMEIFNMYIMYFIV